MPLTDKVDAWQVFWSLITMLVSYVAIMITLFWKKLTKIEEKWEAKCEKYRRECALDCKASRVQRDQCISKVREEALEVAKEIELELSKTAHKHGQFGTAGEVIPK